MNTKILNENFIEVSIEVEKVSYECGSTFVNEVAQGFEVRSKRFYKFADAERWIAEQKESRIGYTSDEWNSRPAKTRNAKIRWVQWELAYET